MQNLASQHNLMFRDDSTQKEVEDHYGRLLQQLKPLGASLKAAANMEKLEKDELEAEMEKLRRERYKRIHTRW